VALAERAATAAVVVVGGHAGLANRFRCRRVCHWRAPPVQIGHRAMMPRLAIPLTLPSGCSRAVPALGLGSLSSSRSAMFRPTSTWS